MGINNQINVGRKEDAGRIKYLLFKLGEDRFGIQLSSVKEVIAIPEVTAVPNVPNYFKGLINLRGQIISVFDLRTKLQMTQSEFKEKKTCIIITEIEDFLLGMIVDEVVSVIDFQNSQIEYDLDINSNVSRDLIIGVAKENTDLILLLDIGKALNINELKAIRDQSRNQIAA